MSGKDDVFGEIQEEHLDMMIRLALKQAEADGLLDNTDTKDEPVSEEEVQRTYELFLEKAKALHEQEGKAEKKKKRRRAAKYTLRALICVILLLAIATPVAIASIAPLREYISRMLTDFKEDHVEVQLIKEKNIVPEGWTGLYYPTYIPDRYTLKRLSTLSWKAEYIDPDNNSLYFCEFDEHESVNLDSEGAEISYELINGMNALILTEEDRVIITWNNNERMFSVLGTMSVAEAKAIAGSVKRVQ